MNTPLTQDPVCGMNITPSAHHTTHNGKTYHFCSQGCLDKFTAAPDHYIHLSHTAHRSAGKSLKYLWPHLKGAVLSILGQKPRLDVAAPAEGQQYTCPMHPEIIEAMPGNCPKCGMALDPMFATASSSHDDSQELAAYTKLKVSFIISLIFTLPVIGIEMVPGVGPLIPGSSLITLLATTIVIFGTGAFIFKRAYVALKHRTMNMFTLVALGTFTAYIYSVVMVVLFRFAPERIPSLALGADGSVGLYFETAATIITLVILGQLLEEAARKQTSKALRNLLDLAPATALRLPAQHGATAHPSSESQKDNNLDEQHTEAFETIPLSSVIKGDVLLVQPGAKVPVDGVVVSGLSEVDEAFLTGEAMLVKKTAGSRVLGGTLNGQGAFTMRADKIGSETFLAEVVSLTERAQRSQPPVQDLTERVTRIFIPSVIVIALISFMAWMFWGPQPPLGYAILAFVGVVIIACPCALGLATPMAITVGISRGAEKGVLIKDATLLEKFSAVTLIAIDKTGTLTHGKPRLAERKVMAAAKDSPHLKDDNLNNPNGHERKVLQLAASLEVLSEHPLAKGMLDGAREEKIALLPVTDFAASIGEGISGTIHGRHYSLGSINMMKRLGVALPEEAAHILKNTGEQTATSEAKHSLSGTMLYLADADHLLGTFALRDTLKETAYETTAKLKARGIKIMLLSGDSKQNCAEVAQALGLDGFYGELRPQDKFNHIETFKRDGHTVLMAGDGVNDAPALAVADVSVAMGTGSDVALETAHATLLKGDLKSLEQLFTLSVKTLRTIKGNLFLAFFYNTVSIPLAAGILYPFWGITLSPMIAALMMILSSISVIGNALRLKRALI